MPTLADAIEQYVTVDRSPYTNRSYRYILGRMSRAIGPERELRLVTYPDLADYLAKLLKRVKRSTAGEYANTIQTFFKWCVERKFIKHSPAEGLQVRPEPLDPTKRRGRAIPPEELLEMVTLARYTSARNHALMLVLVDTGCRVGGLASLTLDHLDLTEKTAWLLEKGSQWHRVYFSAQTGDALRNWLRVRPQCDHDYVFTGKGTKPISRAGIAMMVRQLSKRIGRNYGPHRIRHSVAQALADRNLPPSAVQKKLGHKSPVTTINSYYRQDDEYQRTIADLHGLAALETKANESENVIPLPPKRIVGSG